MKRLGSVLALPLLLAFGWSELAFADDRCSRGEGLPSASASENELRRFIEMCPEHAAALNNLAVLLENKGRLEEAKRLYHRAVAANPSAVAPYAGLGDVLRAQGQLQEAASAYKTFLARLEAVKRAGSSNGLLQYEDVYRDRLAQIPIKAQSSGQVIGAESITRTLTSKPPRTRGLSVRARAEPHIDIHIRFDFDSARLRGGTDEQLDEIARALKHEALKDRHIVIEGHTDSTGTATYNRKLSIKRSATV
ncbi:MAG: OmpA family protein, partial [Alphaproteobacteria bacterium]|nr:OmpA family protein [Alphaproteobacteria bacterium]